MENISDKLLLEMSGEKLVLQPVQALPDLVIYDMFYDGVWHGSRRTTEQCAVYFDNLVNGEAKRLQAQEELEELKGERKKVKEERTANLIAAAGDEAYSDVQSLLSHICAEHPDKAKDAQNKPKAHGWFVGQILKQHKAPPQLVQKVVAEWFASDGEA